MLFKEELAFLNHDGIDKGFKQLRENWFSTFDLDFPNPFDHFFEPLVRERIRFEFSSGHGPPPSGIFQILPLHKISPAPFNRDSGKFRGKRGIWGGRKKVRQALYMAVLAGLRWDRKIREFFTYLTEDGKKAGKVALTACMRKLLTIMNQILKNGTPWEEVSTKANS